MFNDDDVNELSGMSGRIPDGVIDASSYAQILCDIVGFIDELEPDRFDKSILFMTRCVNLAYSCDEDSSEFSQERALDTITGLTLFVMRMYEMMDEYQKAEFIRYQKEEALPEAIRDCQALPFYDLEDEVNSILQVLDEVSDGDFTNVKFITPDEAADYGIDLGEDYET
jgi:hypothetical protein